MIASVKENLFSHYTKFRQRRRVAAAEPVLADGFFAALSEAPTNTQAITLHEPNP